MCWKPAAAGDRTDSQQLVRKVSPGDALVARRTFSALEPSATAREKPGLVRFDASFRKGPGTITRVSRRPLAQDGGTRRPRQPVAYRPSLDLAATAPDLLR